MIMEAKPTQYAMIMEAKPTQYAIMMIMDSEAKPTQYAATRSPSRRSRASESFEAEQTHHGTVTMVPGPLGPRAGPGRSGRGWHPTMARTD